MYWLSNVIWDVHSTISSRATTLTPDIYDVSTFGLPYLVPGMLVVGEACNFRRAIPTLRLHSGLYYWSADYGRTVLPVLERNPNTSRPTGVHAFRPLHEQTCTSRAVSREQGAGEQCPQIGVD